MQDINALIELGAYLGRCKDAANDLWTWLPGYSTTAETPDLVEVLEKAADEIARMKEQKVTAPSIDAEMRRLADHAWCFPAFDPQPVAHVKSVTYDQMDGTPIVELLDAVLGTPWRFPLDAFYREAKPHRGPVPDAYAP